MNASRLATRLSWVLDLIALAALAGTGEVRMEVFVLAATMFFLSRSRMVRLSEKFVMSTLVALVIAAAGAWYRYRFHPILAASYLAPLVHSVLFFAPEAGRYSGRYRGWRIGIGFVELILASSLAPDAYLFPAIFAFVLLAAVTVSSIFLDEELRSRAPEHRDLPLPPGFIRHSMTLAFLIFLSSLIIFPILPRMKMGGGTSDSFKVGYTEHVELSEKKGLNGREGTGEPVLRLYSQKGEDLSKEIFLGLIRGRSLDIFDGQNWISSSQRAQNIGIKYVKPTETRDAIWVDADRSPLRSISLPVPYGAIQVQTGMGVDDSPYPKTTGGEWIDSLSADSRARFSFAFHPYQKYLRSTGVDEDPPLQSDLSVPEALRTARMERLVKTLFGNTTSEAEKAGRLLSFFSKEGFSASFQEAGGSADAPSLMENRIIEKMHPIERFLFLTKEGHCEWFASSSALLLRLAGVPSRLVSGFRIAKGPVGGVLTITTNDAHAWVEYWIPGKGWTALDPTPRILGPSGFLNVFRNGYEWVSAYWYRYVLNFTESRNKQEPSMDASITRPAPEPVKFKNLREKMESFAQRYRAEIIYGVLFSLMLSLAAYFYMRWRYPWIFSIRYRVREGGPVLRRERVKMERLICKRTNSQSIEDAIEILNRSRNLELSVALSEWKETYQRLRFGASDIQTSSEDIALLGRHYRSIKSELKKAPLL